MAKHKLGFITASTVAPFLTGKSGKLIAGGIAAAREIAAERAGLTSDDDNTFEGGVYTNWGNEHEPDALKAYEARELVEIHGSQEQIEVFEIEGVATRISCTPDGLVGEQGMVEAKSPAVMKYHRENLLRSAWVADYFDQCQFQMLVSGRKWVDLLSYDPRVEEWAQLVVKRIERDEDRIAFILDRIIQAEAVIKEELELIEAVKLARG